MPQSSLLPNEDVLEDAKNGRGLLELVIRDRLAIAYGVLTVDNRDQTWAEASAGKDNKGGFVAVTAHRMIALKQKFGLMPI